MFGSFPPSPLVVSASKVYSGLGADIVYGIISLIDSKQSFRRAAECLDGRFKIPATPKHLAIIGCSRCSEVAEMDKKQIESPKLTANFLLWIGLFLLAMFLLIA